MVSHKMRSTIRILLLLVATVILWVSYGYITFTNLLPHAAFVWVTASVLAQTLLIVVLVYDHDYFVKG